MRSSPTDDEIAHRAAIVCETMTWLGTPYRHQASQKGQGADCLGLIRGVYEAFSSQDATMIKVPPYPVETASTEETLLDGAKAYLIEEAIEAPLAGHVLLFRMQSGAPARHCGIYIGAGRFVHAYSGRAVTASWYARYWQERLAGIFSYPRTDLKRGQA